MIKSPGRGAHFRYKRQSNEFQFPTKIDLEKFLVGILRDVCLQEQSYDTEP